METLKLGDKVKILYPFNSTYTGIYTIIDIIDNTYFLDKIEGGFCIDYLEVANGY